MAMIVMHAKAAEFYNIQIVRTQLLMMVTLIHFKMAECQDLLNR